MLRDAGDDVRFLLHNGLYRDYIGMMENEMEATI